SEERLKYQKERHTSIENEYQSLIEKEKELKLKINDLDEISKEEKTSKEMDQTLKEKERIKEKLTFELNKHRNEVADATVLISDAERELKEEIKKREKISSEIQEEELKVNRMDVMLETKIYHLQTTYEISYDKVIVEYEEMSVLESVTVDVVKLTNDN